MNEQASRHHLLFDEDAKRIVTTTNDITEVGRNIGGTAFWFPSGFSEQQHLKNRMNGPVAPNDDVNW